MSAAVGEVGDHAAAVEELVARAVRTIPFYAEHLAGREHAPFTELPTCTKASLAAWGARPLEGNELARRYCATSGTTGPRLLVGFSAADWERLGEHLGRRGRALGLGPDDLLANSHGYGLWIGGPALELMAQRAGAAMLPVGPGHTEQLARWLGELPVTALSATPSFLRYLVERAGADGLDPATWTLRLGLIGGEGASLALRREVGARLGTFRWQELYGATEVGGPTLGWSPPDDPLAGRLLVDTDEFVVELLHPDQDEPAREGELGEITVTTPYRESSPLVRYRMRDLALALPDVIDPSGFPSISALHGRVDDALKVRGALVYPAVVEDVVVANTRPGAEWRIIVDRDPGQLDTMTVVVEGAADDLATMLSDRLGVRVEVIAVESNRLARFDGKAARVDDRRRRSPSG